MNDQNSKITIDSKERFIEPKKASDEKSLFRRLVINNVRSALRFIGRNVRGQYREDTTLLRRFEK